MSDRPCLVFFGIHYPLAPFLHASPPVHVFTYKIVGDRRTMVHGRTDFFLFLVLRFICITSVRCEEATYPL